jgi:hypothetical protein
VLGQFWFQRAIVSTSAVYPTSVEDGVPRYAHKSKISSLSSCSKNPFADLEKNLSPIHSATYLKFFVPLAHAAGYRESN